MARYNPLHPEQYPVAWLSAAKAAADAPGKWISADWAKSEHAAVSRMKRMRAFRDGLKEHRLFPWIERMTATGRGLTFRKVPAFGVWDVQMSWQEGKPSAGELVERALGGGEKEGESK